MKKTRLFLTLCMLVYISIGAQNLINKGNMENSAGWAINKRATDLVISYENSEGNSGSMALKMATTNMADDFYVVSNNTFFSVTQNTNIKITFWAKGSSCGMEFTPFFQESDGFSLTNFPTTIIETTYLKEYILTKQITSNTSSKYKFKMRGSGGALGDIYIDNVIVELGDGTFSKTKNDIKTKNVNKPSILIYPNPTNDYLHIDEKQNYEVFNTMGQKVLNGNSKKIDVRNLNAGIYIISIDNRVKYKFIKR
jgi:uncharacterized protein YcnI